MNDEEQPGSTGLSAADEARVRDLLADAKHDEPMPDAVVARLDRVLAGLAEEPVEQPLPGNVVPLAERRRRATRMLVAAAAVVVVGVGIGQVVSHNNGELSSGAAGAARTSPDADSGTSELTDKSQGVDAPQPSSGSLDGVAAFKVRPQHFARDSRRVQTNSMADMASLRAESFGCARGHWGAGKYVPVEYGRTPAYLVLRRHTGDSQVADLFLCGSDDPVRSVTLPGP